MIRVLKVCTRPPIFQKYYLWKNWSQWIVAIIINSFLPVLFIGLTSDQTLNKKCQPKFFVVVSVQWKEQVTRNQLWMLQLLIYLLCALKLSWKDDKIQDFYWNIFNIHKCITTRLCLNVKIIQSNKQKNVCKFWIISLIQNRPGQPDWVM